MDSELFERRATRKSMALGMVWTLLAAALGLFVFTGADGRPLRTLLSLAFLVGGAAFFLAFAWWTIRPPVGLRLSAAGIKMGSPVGGTFQNLPWSEVRAVRVVPHNGKLVVALDPIDPEYGMQGLREHPLKMRRERRDALGSWMVLYPGAFGMAPEELAERIEAFHERFRPGAAPTYPRPA